MIDNLVCLWRLTSKELVPMHACKHVRFELRKQVSARQAQLILSGIDHVMVRKGGR